ncbi:hypothetical protein [Pseudooceanicola sp. MF1-13]|uniref:hypothetical protein n=1 Tax=Pseudooceanicola sp. MF1-13 TaxID=3379095 RepID=UPI003891FE8E
MNFLNTRRQMLLGLAAASTAAAAGAPAAERLIPENPELIALGNATLTLQRNYEETRAEARRIAKDVRQEWPLAPEPILSFGHGCLEERDVTGAGIRRAVDERGNFEQMWSYGTPEYFEAQIQRHKVRIAHIMKTKSKRGLKFEQEWLKRSEEALPLSRTYVAEIERLKQQSGYRPARDRQEAAYEAFSDHVSKVMGAEAATMEGVVIKAQALQAWSTVDPFYKALNKHGVEWAEQLAGAIIAQGEGRA